MRLYEIQMEGFRGYPACLPLKLDYDVVIIFGDNGSGKSGLFNAMEWLLEGTVDLGECRDAKTGDRFRNLFTECEKPWVRLTFSKKEGGRTVQCQVTRRLKAGTFQSSRINPEDELLQPSLYPDRLLSRKTLDEQCICYDWPLRYERGEFEQVFLNRKRLGRFIEVTGDKRGEQLFKLLGYGVLDEHRDTIDKLLGFLRRYRRDEGLEKTFGDRCAVLGNKIVAICEGHSGVPESIQTFLSICQELIEGAREQVREEYPFYLGGLLDLLRGQLQHYQDSHDLTSEERENAEEKLQEARTALEKQQDLSEFFASERWIDPTECEVLDVDTQEEIEQQLSKSPNLLERVQRFQDDPEMFDLEARLDFLKYGLHLIEKEERDTCPLCLQDITGRWDETEMTVKEHFVSEHRGFLERYRNFDPKDALVSDLRQARRLLQFVDCIDKLDRNQRILRGHFNAYKAWADSLGEEVSRPDFDALAPSELGFSPPKLLLESLDLALQFLDRPEEVEFTPLDGLSKQIEATARLTEQLGEVQRATQESIDSLNSQYQRTRKSLEERKQEGLDEEVQKWEARLAQFELLDDLQGLESEVEDLEEATERISTVNKYIRPLLDARDNTLKDVEEILLMEAIERISDRVNEVYERMNPDEALNRIIFKPAGGRNVDLIVDDENIDLSYKELRPQAFLSEGHLNCLGIAIHLALQEVIDSPYDFVIFDDPLYSIDAGHRRKARDEMFDFAKRTGKQLIIATHDPLFFHYLKEKLRFRHADFGNKQIYLVINYSSTEPDIIPERRSKGTFLDAAKEWLVEGCDSYELEAVYVLMRREIEYLCDNLLKGQRVAEYGEKYDKLDSRIDLLRRLEHIDDTDINKLQEARTICNPAAHYDPSGRESYTVARQVLTSIETFRDKYRVALSDS